MRLMLPRLAAASLAVAGLLAAGSAHAVDGVVLIDQTSIPLHITQPGSYRLSSNIVAPGPAGAIKIRSNDVTLDLNGFTIVGDGTFADGIAISAHNVEVRNGTVRGFGRHGIFALNAGCFRCTDAEGVRVFHVRAVENTFNGFAMESQGALVDKCSAHSNGGHGFYMGGDGGLLTNSVARVNGGFGMIAGGFATGYRSNVFTANNGGDANPQATNGVNLGENLCGLAVCP
jgi:hypothetical protein